MTRHPLNASGAFYVDQDACIACSSCFIEDPDHITFADEDGKSYVSKQPAGVAEIAVLREAMSVCPVEAVKEQA